MSKPVVYLLLLWIALAGCSTVSQRTMSPRDADGHRPRPRPALPVHRTATPAEPIERVPDAPRVATPAAITPEPARAPAPTYAETWIALNRWTRERGLGSWQRVSSGPAPAFMLASTNGSLLVKAGNLAAAWDGLEFHLGFEPLLINDQLFLHVLDVRKHLEPLLQPSFRTCGGGIIVLDPGHGGQNPGTSSVLDGTEEKQYTLDWARRVAPLLQAGGWQVFLTRTNDTDVALSDRVAFAEERGADLFISLHFNSAAPSQEQYGVETYSLTPAGMPSTLTRGNEDDLTAVYTNNSFDSENLQLAVRLHRALVPVAGNDRGIRHARFLGVLRNQNRPALLLEGGYLSNPGEAQAIADPAYRQKLAEAIAQALNPGPALPLQAGAMRSAALSGATNGGAEIAPAAGPAWAPKPALVR